MPKSDKKIDLKNHLALPGLIDPHVHLRDEGKSYKEDFYSGTAAASAGGFTTVLDMPNNKPITLSAELLKNRMRLAQNNILVNVGFYSEFPTNLKEISNIVDQGAIGFKLFMARQIGGLNIDDDEMLKKAFNQIRNFKSILAIHAEDKNLLQKNEKKQKNKQKDDLNAFYKAHTEEVEYTAIKRILKLNQKINAPIHFCHLTTKYGLQLIKEAKKTNPTISCETTPNHLFLSKTHSDLYGSLIVMMPPLRERTTVDTLWNGIRNGIIDFIGSDHAPHSIEEKNNSSVWDVKVGLPGLETTLPLMLTKVNKHQISIGDLVLWLSKNPAKIFRLNKLGSIQKGKKADLTIIDLKKKHKINSSNFHSKAKYSPYDGWEVKGMPIKTFVNGILIMEDQRIIAERGSGSILRRNIKLNSF